MLVTRLVPKDFDVSTPYVMWRSLPAAAWVQLSVLFCGIGSEFGCGLEILESLIGTLLGAT